MIRFNVIGIGFLDLAEGTSIGFKQDNQHFRFADISLGRSVQFSIPATDRNRLLLGFADDPANPADLIRQLLPCQMAYDGGQVMGTLAVTGYSSEAFSCVFYIGGSTWADRLQNLSLKDCPTTLNTPIAWDVATPVVTADMADPSMGVQLIQYSNGIVNGTSWQYVPSVNVLTYITDILANLGVPFSTTLSDKYWMVSGSMKGGGNGVVEFDVTATNSATLPTMSPACFSVESFTLEWSRGEIFGAYVGGGSTTAAGFKCTRGVSLTFPTMPADIYLIKYNEKLGRCEVLGGKFTGMDGIVHGNNPLDGRTVAINKGDIIFFATHGGGIGDTMPQDDGLGIYYGWKDIAYPFNVTCNTDLSGDIVLGDNWYLRDNQPDMTVFEFLKSVALASGLELTIDPETGVTLAEGSYGQAGDFRVLEDVVSVDGVTRCVASWGSGSAKVSDAFDSEEYVESRIHSDFFIKNENFQEDKEYKSRFSEGSFDTNGILIQDVDGVQFKFTAKRWSIAYADPLLKSLQRVPFPQPVGYDDIAANSTCVKVKVAAGEADLFALKPSTTFLWRGMAYIWTDASLSGGVMSLTLQKVSQRA